MNHLYSTAREITDLSDVQIKILVHMEEALSFAADIQKIKYVYSLKEKIKIYLYRLLPSAHRIPPVLLT